MHELLLMHWGVQEMTRTFRNGEQETAVLVPKELPREAANTVMRTETARGRNERGFSQVGAEFSWAGERKPQLRCHLP
jgi:hypothetical protein